MKLNNKTLWIPISVGMLILIAGCQNKVSLSSLLDEMTDRETLTRLPEPEYVLRQVSSYNRHTKEPGNYDWYANYDASWFDRVEEYQGRREFVMMDVEGPGAIVRWWMTFWRAQDGILRIYLDGDSIAEFQGAPYDLISGQMLAGKPLSIGVPEEGPREEQGNNLYLPIPFAKHCKITYESDSLVVYEDKYFPDVFYNINYRVYDSGTAVETLSKKILEASESKIRKTNDKLMTDLQAEQIYSEFKEEVLPNDTLKISIDKRGKAISWLSLSVQGSDPDQALRSTLLAVEFDGQQTIWVPVGEFFGTGYRIFPHRTVMNESAENGQMQSHWLMPFQKGARVMLINFGDEKVNMEGEIGLNRYSWNDRSMYFAATWHEYHHIKTRDTLNWFFDVNYVDVAGQGKYVGDQVTLFNMALTWWGEGDEKIFVDGEAFPSSLGTGSEDYYGYAFGRPEAFSHPFISQPSGAGNFVPGITVNMRHRVLDAIPFTKSMSSNIELWHWASTCINYAMTSYFYVQVPYSVNIASDIEMARRNVATDSLDFFNGNDTLCRTIDQF